jgi:hypothetical protein
MNLDYRSQPHSIQRVFKNEQNRLLMGAKIDTSDICPLDPASLAVSLSGATCRERNG